jgi:hypothetical protein
MGEDQGTEGCFYRHSEAHNVSSRPEENRGSTESTLGESAETTEGSLTLREGLKGSLGFF